MKAFRWEPKAPSATLRHLSDPSSNCCTAVAPCQKTAQASTQRQSLRALVRPMLLLDIKFAFCKPVRLKICCPFTRTWTPLLALSTQCALSRLLSGGLQYLACAALNTADECGREGLLFLGSCCKQCLLFLLCLCQSLERTFCES